MIGYLRKFLKRAYIRINRLFFSCFYPSRYLRGKYFDQHLVGWSWARRALVCQKLLNNNRQVPWPVGRDVHITGDKINFDPADINNFHSFGIYYQAVDASITIGSGSYIAPNVGLITSNHSLSDPDLHMPGEDIVIGEKCWIGMNAVIMPGVVLGDHTVVGAGAVVTKSFPEGWCVLAGTPAKIIKAIQGNENI